MTERVLRGNETILQIPAYIKDGVAQLLMPGAMAPITSPTTAILNHWIPVTTNGHANAAGGGNVSRAILDNLTLGMTDSDSDSDRVVTDAAQVEELTVKKFDASLTGLIDADPAANGVFNLFRRLTFAPDVLYIIAHRIGEKHTTLATTGEMWDFYLVGTDIQVLNYANNANLSITSAFLPKQQVNFGHKLTA